MEDRSFYNHPVLSTLSFPLQRWLTMLLTGLLMLTPFLHSHLGAVHNPGFHIDGIPRMELPAAQTSVDASSDEESRAWGVSTSIVQEVDMPFWLAAWALWLGSFCTLLVPLLQGLKTVGAHTPVRHCYHPGLPPPGLSPPQV